MKKLLLVFIVSVGLTSCFHKTQIHLEFLDEYVIPYSLEYKNSLIGGLSGVDYANGFYYFVVDDSRNPRFLKSKITFSEDTISSVDFKDVVFLNDTTEVFYENNALDLESIFIDDEAGEINFVSEGSIFDGKSPSVFVSDSLGKFVYNYTIPDYFIPNAVAKLKHNGAFEGSSKSVDGKGFWVAMESPLIIDGEEPTFKKKSSPIRITYFDKISKKAKKQFSYQLDSISRPVKGRINLNGLTAILEYQKNKFFIIERTYQSNYGTQGNVVKVYDVDLNDKTTNTLSVKSLKETDFIPAKKRLLLNFEDVKSSLTDSIVDNIEGITFGPKLSNGNKSLLLVSDDNFQKFGKQLNQFLLLEIIEK